MRRESIKRKNEDENIERKDEDENGKRDEKEEKEEIKEVRGLSLKYVSLEMYSLIQFQEIRADVDIKPEETETTSWRGHHSS